MNEEKLLAKSKIDGVLYAGCYLTQHTLDVMRAVESILFVLEKDILRFFKLEDSQLKNLLATTRMAALWHDIGKANDGFQKAVLKKGRQEIRHEHLSTILMSIDEVREWLSTEPDVNSTVLDADYEVARVIVASHHMQLTGEDIASLRIPRFAFPFNGDGGLPFDALNDRDDFKELLMNFCAPPFNLSAPSFQIPQRWSFNSNEIGENIRKWRERIKSEFDDFIDELENDKPRRRLLMAARTVLLAADASASGLRRVDVKQGEEWSPDEWIKNCLKQVSRPENIEEIIAKRKAEVTERKRKAGDANFEFVERDFQKAAASLGERSLLLTPCGSGKTLAAYNWIKAQLSLHGYAKVVFLYPTTGTATEGFKDYASHDPRAGLVHSRAQFDLVDMFENPDERSGSNYTSEKKRRLFALGFWGDSIFSATVDAFLSFLQNNYSSVCLLPVLARSVVVIDEIHSFDQAMFSELIEFLVIFDVPVLMMTASLPKKRRQQLEREIKDLQVYPRTGTPEADEVKDSADAERYHIRYYRIVDLDKHGVPLESGELMNIARQAYRAGRKVLWVVNTVDRCIRIAEMLWDVGAICYHSRFMYEHRVKRHRKVVDDFQDPDIKGVIAVTTQVCEMSLDLDADVLITELAPAPSLIQRMGRCNRTTPTRSLDISGEVHIYDPPSPLPYEDKSLDTGRQLLQHLKLESVKQSHLNDALESIAFDNERAKACLFTMPIWEAYSRRDFRETDDYTTSAVLATKLPDFLKAQRERKPTAGLILQAPYRFTEERPNTWIRVVDDESLPKRFKYCEDYGLREVEV